MIVYTLKHRLTALAVSVVLLTAGVAASYWLWLDHWCNPVIAAQLHFDQFGQMARSMTASSYICLIIGLIFIQEMSMIFCRYCLGRQGKKERLYIQWRNHRFGVHHLHWGLVIVAIGIIGELTNTHSNLLLIAIGVSSILTDLLHHQVLELLHGDQEGDGPPRNPFQTKKSPTKG